MEDYKIEDVELEEVCGGSYKGPCFVYLIKKNDTLSEIAQRYGTTVKIRCDINKIDNPNLIYEGNKLLVPYNQ